MSLSEVLLVAIGGGTEQEPTNPLNQKDDSKFRYYCIWQINGKQMLYFCNKNSMWDIILKSKPRQIK